MDWKQLIKDLSDAGLTQMQIADRCGVAQSTVSDLGRGVSNSPSFQLGSKLLELRTACAPADPNAEKVRDAA